MIVNHDHFEIWPFSSRIDAFQAKPVQFEIVIGDDDNRSLLENITNGGSEHLVTFLPGILFRKCASGLDQLQGAIQSRLHQRRECVPTRASLSQIGNEFGVEPIRDSAIVTDDWP